MTEVPPDGSPGQPDHDQTLNFSDQGYQPYVPGQYPSSPSTQPGEKIIVKKAIKLAFIFGSMSLMVAAIYFSLVFTNVITLPGFESSPGKKSIGESVAQDDVKVVKKSVDLNEEGLAVFTAKIMNNTDSDTAFRVKVKCRGGGENLTGFTDTEVVGVGKTFEAITKIKFNPSGTFLTVFCDVEEIRFLEN